MINTNSDHLARGTDNTKYFLAAWSFFSPISWFGLLILSLSNDVHSTKWALIFAFLVMFSLMASCMSAILAFKNNDFFKSMSKLEEEADNHIKAREMYIRKLEQLNTTTV